MFLLVHFSTGSIHWETGFVNSVVPINGPSSLIKFLLEATDRRTETRRKECVYRDVDFKMAFQ